ncbi:hypothetical protein B0H13DRAFT_1914682 [Mycena leptocephala]|nr:hypothetical protein B0H13DRAFT_1914682 [Mycena leptocephala]
MGPHLDGDLPRALGLCMQAEQLMMPGWMGGSDWYLGILDLRADISGSKMVARTSPTCSPRFHAHALCGIAEMDILMEGEVSDIVSTLNGAKTVYEALDSPRVLFCSWVAAELRLYLGNIESARAAFLHCLSESRGVYSDIPQYCLAALADPVHKMYGKTETFRWAVVYLAFVQKKKDVVGGLQALRRLADVLILLEDEETALHLFQAALKGGTSMGIHHLRAECMVGIGDIMLRHREIMQAMDMWEAAYPLFSMRDGSPSLQSETDEDPGKLQLTQELLAL